MHRKVKPPEKKKVIDHKEHKEHKEHKKSRGYRQEFSFVPFVPFVVKQSFFSAVVWIFCLRLSAA